MTVKKGFQQERNKKFQNVFKKAFRCLCVLVFEVMHCYGSVTAMAKSVNFQSSSKEVSHPRGLLVHLRSRSIFQAFCFPSKVKIFFGSSQASTSTKTFALFAEPSENCQNCYQVEIRHSSVNIAISQVA
jgi:hypothetical protein